MAPARAARLATTVPVERPVAPSHPANRARLEVLGRAELEDRRLRRRARFVWAAAAICVAVALVIVAAGQAFVAAQQVHLDRTQEQLATSVAKNQNLLLTRAQLESPTRILSFAEHELGMVVPSHVTYLVPVDPNRSGAISAPTTAT